MSVPLPASFKSFFLYVESKNLFNLAKRRFQPSIPPPLRHDADKLTPLFANSSTNFTKLVLPNLAEFSSRLGQIFNGQFESTDLETYYCLIRHSRPTTIIEIGSGNSTQIALQALMHNGHGQLISIDPAPRTPLPPQVSHLRQKIQTISPNLFKSLKSNDILFIDSSHTTAEANYHTQHLLPLLKPGVIIHHHDILFPFDIYHHHNPKKFGEPDVILNYYHLHRNQFQILFGLAYLKHTHPYLIHNHIHSSRWLPHHIPGSLWVKKIN